MTNVIYEHPLNERTRTLLRLAHLFEQFEHHLPLPSAWDSRAALSALLDIANVLARADIKSEFIKELERHNSNLSRMRSTRGVDTERLEQVLTRIQQATQALHGSSGQLGHELRNHEFLTAIQQRSTIPGGNCGFDLPQYHQWLSRPLPGRQQDLQAWIATLGPLREAIELLLTLIRGSCNSTQESAEEGFFQKTLGNEIAAQLLRISLPDGAGLFPEISGNKHRFSIRFMQADPLEHQAPSKLTVNFGLGICVI